MMDKRQKDKDAYSLNVDFTARDIADFRHWVLLHERLAEVRGETQGFDWLKFNLHAPDGTAFTNTSADGETVHLACFAINLPGIFWPTPNSICFEFRSVLFRIHFKSWPDEIQRECPSIRARNKRMGLTMPPLPSDIYSEFYEAMDARLRLEESKAKEKKLARALKKLEHTARSLTVAEIAHEANLRQQTISKRIKSLIKRGWIEPRKDVGKQFYDADEAGLIISYPKGRKK